MSTLRRLSAATAAGMLALVALAPPASAAEPTVQWTRPSPEENVLDEQGLITGTITGEETQTIETLEFDLTSEASAAPDDPCFVDVPNETVVLDGHRSHDFELGLVFPCNRFYQLEIRVGYEDSAGLVGDVLPARETATSSIPFSVAIPPAKVGGTDASFDEGTREVRLTWAPNSEPDLLGYYVERNPPGPAGFSRITPDPLPPDQTSFTDPGIEDEHRYRIISIRQGPNGPQDEIRGGPSSTLIAGPERTEPTLPDDLPPPNSRPPAASGGGGSATTPRRPAPAPSQTRTTSNIFVGNLPFDPSQTTLPQATIRPPGDAAVLAEFDDEAPDDRRATMVPIAGGLALVVGAMHLFLLSKRAGELDDIPMSPR